MQVALHAEGEGDYPLHSEKQHGLIAFSARRGTRLTLAEIPEGPEEGVYVVYNVGDYLHIAAYDATEKVRGGGGGAPPA